MQSATHQQVRYKSRSKSHEESADDEDEEPDKSQSKKLSATGNPKLSDYPPGWKSLLLIGKQRMARHVALYNAFPEKSKDLKVATMIVSDLIQEYNNEGKELEQGLIFYRFLYVLDS